MELAGPGIFLIASLDAMSSVEWPLALLASGLVCLAVKRPGLRVKGFTEAHRWGVRLLSGAEGLTFGRNLRAQLPSCRCYLTAAILPLLSYHLVTSPPPYYRCHLAVTFQAHPPYREQSHRGDGHRPSIADGGHRQIHLQGIGS